MTDPGTSEPLSAGLQEIVDDFADLAGQEKLQLLLKRDLEVVAGHRLVRTQRRNLPQRPLVELRRVHPISARNAGLGRARAVIGGGRPRRDLGRNRPKRARSR